MRCPWLACIGLLALAGVAHGQSIGEANRLFDAARWPEAAVAQNDVALSPSSTQADKELAELRTAIALHHMGLLQPAYAKLAYISDKPNHSKWAEAALWLAKLSEELPDAADVMERVGKYDDTTIARFNNPEQRDVFWRLSYLRGRYEDRNNSPDEAISEYGRVAPASPLYGKAQILSGMVSVKNRRAVPAVEAFQRALAWEGADGRLRDLASLSIARTYYSAAIKLDENNAPTVDSMRLSAAIKYWRQVDPTGPFYFDVLFEESWGRFMAGDYTHALGNLHVLSAPEIASRYPEAAVLEGTILFDLCRYDDAVTSLTKTKQAYEARRSALARKIEVYEHASAGQGRAEIPNVDELGPDRMMKDHLAYVALLEGERKLLGETPAAFRASKLADEVRDDIELATEIELRNAGELAHQRLLRARDELGEHLRDVLKLLIDTTAAQRNIIEGGGASTEATHDAGIKPLVLGWPINGALVSLDPAGPYRAPLTSRCSR